LNLWQGADSAGKSNFPENVLFKLGLSFPQNFQILVWKSSTLVIVKWFLVAIWKLKKNTKILFRGIDGLWQVIWYTRFTNWFSGKICFFQADCAS